MKISSIKKNTYNPQVRSDLLWYFTLRLYIQSPFVCLMQMKCLSISHSESFNNYNIILCVCINAFHARYLHNVIFRNMNHEITQVVHAEYYMLYCANSFPLHKLIVLVTNLAYQLSLLLQPKVVTNPIV